MKDNREILQEIQNALAKEISLASCLSNIYVLVNDGAVIMAGSVDSANLKSKAHDIVKNIPGVDLLIEDLKVEPPQSHRMGVQIDWANGRMALNQTS